MVKKDFIISPRCVIFKLYGWAQKTLKSSNSSQKQRERVVVGGREREGGSDSDSSKVKEVNEYKLVFQGLFTSHELTLNFFVLNNKYQQHTYKYTLKVLHTAHSTARKYSRKLPLDILAPRGRYFSTNYIPGTKRKALARPYYATIARPGKIDGTNF